MTDRISEIRARHEAATSGEWRVHESHNWHKDPPKEYFILAKGSSWVVASWVEKADAEAIVNAHNDILCLLDLIEVMQAENTEMHEWYTLLQKNCNAQFARAEEAEAQLKEYRTIGFTPLGVAELQRLAKERAQESVELQAQLAELPTCEGCKWQNRRQKCNCCRRNSGMADLYEGVRK